MDLLESPCLIMENQPELNQNWPQDRPNTPRWSV